MRLREFVAAAVMIAACAAQARGQDATGWNAGVSLANVYEGNVNHDVAPVQSYGLVPAFTLAFATPKSGFTFDYEIANNRYTATNEWDRVSHSLESTLRRSFGKRLRLEATGEASVKGTSEDRELANMVGVSPRAVITVAKRTRVSLSGSYRYKEYVDDPGSTGPSPSAGIKLDQRFGSSRLTVGYKYQARRSQVVRNRYRRSAYTAELARPLGPSGNRAGVELEYRSQEYERLIKVDGRRVPRIDHRVAAALHYDQAIGPRTFVRWMYAFERRDSNDVDKRFFAPVAAMTVHYEFR